MTIQISFAQAPKQQSDTAIFFVYKDRTLSTSAKKLDNSLQGFIQNAVKKHAVFQGNKGQYLCLYLPARKKYQQVILVGLGDVSKLTAGDCESLGGKLYPHLKQAGAKHITLHPDHSKDFQSVTIEDMSAAFAGGIKLRSYTYTKYQDKKAKNKKNKSAQEPTKIEVIHTKHLNLKKAYAPHDAGVEGTFFARDVMNEPPNALYPDSYAKWVAKELRPLGVTISVFDEKMMKTKGFLSAYEVGKGSARPSRIVVMRWNGKKKASQTSQKTSKKAKSAPIAFIGKGVTFDTGGISLKPGASMDEMKMDMGGSATVVGLFKALALRKAKVDAIGIIGLVENMPSDRAYRPGDIIPSMAGKTIEVLNTDAEGRLVLCDCMTYIQRTYKPRLMIDLATLTGAMMVALGHEYCGVFSNDDGLWQDLEQAGKDSREKIWRMPLDQAYKDAMKSKIADLNNLGNMGRFGGACTAAGFLQHFVEKEDLPWAHMDIAGKMMQKSDTDTVPRGGVGFGVRLLNRFVLNSYG